MKISKDSRNDFRRVGHSDYRKELTKEDVVDYAYYLFHRKDNTSGQRSVRTRALLKIISIVMEDELTDKQREAVELCKFKGMSNKEAAEILGVSESTICRHLQKASEKFEHAYKYYSVLERVFLDD